MPKSRREQKRARREAKRKEKRKAIKTQSQPRGKKAMLRAALAWPVMECWVNEDWEDPTQLNQVIVTRRDPATGEVYAATYLVDRACLGVKNADAANFIDAGEFRREVLSILGQNQELIQIDFNLAAKIVKTGIEYAAQFGFRPHRDYRDASILLQDADPDAVDVEIPVGGPEGKPFFIAGPYDNADKIMSRLRQQLGPEGFNFMMPIDPETGFFLDDDEDEEDILDVDDVEIIELSDKEYTFTPDHKVDDSAA
ncbi:MAG: hypothetical protein JXR84_06575 [Anaerolineae bacterium]|nr:hypothetical protein [Anaerolineae bacterium]